MKLFFTLSLLLIVSSCGPVTDNEQVSELSAVKKKVIIKKIPTKPKQNIIEKMISVISPTKEGLALLDTIAYAEGTDRSENDGRQGYNKLFGHGLFTADCAKGHPKGIVNKGKFSSSAAGRYQFLLESWEWINSGKNTNFCSDNQNYSALKHMILLKRLGEKTNPYTFLDATTFATLIIKISSLWASLPKNNNKKPIGYYKKQPAPFCTSTLYKVYLNSAK